MAKQRNNPPRRNRKLWPHIPDGNDIMLLCKPIINRGDDPGEGQPLFWFTTNRQDAPEVINICHIPHGWFWYLLDYMRGKGPFKSEKMRFGFRTFCPRRLTTCDVEWSRELLEDAFNNFNRCFAETQWSNQKKYDEMLRVFKVQIDTEPLV